MDSSWLWNGGVSPKSFPAIPIFGVVALIGVLGVYL